MTEVSYVHLQKSEDEGTLAERAKRMRKLRLLSLQTDPGSFISRYQDEVDQPSAFWVDRLKDPSAEHFVAVTDTQCLGDDGRIITATEYAAFLVVLKPSPTTAAEESDASKYLMAAVYVHPDHRGRGVCSRLIRIAIQWVSNDAQSNNVEGAIIRTNAAESNIAAQRLYTKLGFNLGSRDVVKNKVGEDVPVINLELQLP